MIGEYVYMTYKHSFKGAMNLIDTLFTNHYRSFVAASLSCLSYN